MGVTSIEWTDRSINPIRARDPKTGAVGHYCEMYSAGCAHCYASTLQKRFRMPKFPGKPREPSTAILQGDVIKIRGLEVFLDESKLQEVLKRRKPTKWFWCDMTDMFGSWVPEPWLDRMFEVMERTPQHTHQVLTKRPERMREYTGWRWGKREDEPGHRIPARNVWLGTSVENQQAADERIPHLLRCPAAVRFLSCEPLLGPIDLASAVVKRRIGDPQPDWVIVGGESGHGARPCNVAWARSIVEQCKAAGVSCFVKQLGAFPVIDNPELALIADGTGNKRPLPDRLPLGDSKGGDWNEWPADLRVRQFPRTATAKV